MVASDTFLTRLARFARDLTAADVPDVVVQRVRLQHIGFAASLRAVSALPLAQQLAAAGGRRGRARLVTGGTAPSRDAARLHAALGGGYAWDDHLFAGHTGAGAVSASWALAKTHSVDDLICATVAANEVAGRLGAALLIGPHQGEALGQVHALAAATAAGWLEGLDQHKLAHAMALAVTGSAGIPFGVLAGDRSGAAMAIGAAVQHGFDAVQMAKKGVQGPLDAIEARGGVLEAGCWLPLRAAFTGLGSAWLSNTLAYKLLPAADPFQAPLQAVQMVLQRHLKAADKRLRADQIKEIEVKLGAPGWSVVQGAVKGVGRDAMGLPYDLQRAIGALVVEHDLGTNQLAAEWWSSRGEAASMVAGRVRVVHDWQQTMDVTRGLVAVFAPLLAGVTFSELRMVARRAEEAHGRLPRPGLADVLAIAKARPDQLMERIRYASGDLSDARIDEWQLRFGAAVRVSTTRGGSWPSTQEIAVASPGWSWEETQRLVVEHHANAAQTDAASTQPLLDIEAGADAMDWLDRLIG